MRALLLAGGRSRRMGKDKALIEVDGKAMIARVVDALVKAGREPIRIAVATPEKMDGTRLVVKAGYHNTQMVEALGGACHGCTRIRSSAARRLDTTCAASPAGHPTPCLLE